MEYSCRFSGQASTFTDKAAGRWDRFWHVSDLNFDKIVGCGRQEETESEKVGQHLPFQLRAASSAPGY